MKESGLEGYEYFAYISYCDEDAAFAKKLQRHLEKYKLPVLLSRQYPRTPRKLTPVFRDDLPQSGALARTKFLIPICTETSARVDEWGGSRVDAEVHDFVTVNPSVNRSRVIPIIYRKKDGARATACIPAAVKALDLLALDVLDKGYEQVCNQLVSRMVGIKPGILWNRWLRKARKNMAILAAISFTVLLAALVAIGGGPGLSLLTATLTVLIGVLCAHWYTTPRIALFERFIEANNLPVGIRKLSAKQALCRAYHYRFTYRGFRLVKVECCNSSGVPLPQQRPGFTHDEVACMELFYNERGQVNRQHLFDEHGMPLREVLFEQQDGQDWVNFRSPGGDFADSHLLTKKDGLNSPVTRYQVQRNPQGHITEVHYCNTTGALCADCDGTWGRRYAINTVLGVVTERTYLDEKGAAMPNREGVAGRTYEYDSAGRMLAFSNVNARGEAMFNHALVATMRCKLDAHGNRISVSYHAPNGQRELCHQLMAEKRTTYDTRGFITAEAYFDKDGMPTINRDGFSRCEYTRNAAGSITEVRYFDTAESPCLGIGYVHHEIRTLDSYGNCSTITCFNHEDKPCLNIDSAHRIIQQYDDDGQLRSCHFFNVEGLPSLNRQGYHGVRYTYDAQGNNIQESYFGTDNHPCCCKDGMASISRKYDPHHNCTFESYYGTDGMLCTHSITHIATIEREYDESNNKIKEGYLGINQKQSLNQEGISTIIREYDERGIAVVIRYYDRYIANGLKREILREELITDRYGKYTEKSIFMKRPQPVSSEKWQYNDLGLTIIHTVSTVNKKEQTFENHHQTHYEYDNKHRIIAKKYTDTECSPIVDTYGVTEYRYEYDERGNITTESYYGLTGAPILHSERYAQVKMFYDSMSHPTDYYYCDENGQPCTCSKGYSSMHYHYDEYGRPIRIHYRNRDGGPASSTGYTICCYQYDGLGKITKGAYYNEHNQPVIDPHTGIASFTCEYDKDGRKIRERFFDTDGTPYPCSGLNVAIIEWSYTSNNQVNMLRFRNEQGQLCTCTYGYAIKLNIFEANGSLKEEAFYNHDCSIVFKTKRIKTGVDITCSQIRNENHLYRGHALSLLKTSYTPHWIGREHVFISYNENGNPIEESVYGSDGKLFKHIFSSYAKITYSYNADGKLIEEAFCNEYGNLCLNKRNGYAQKTYSYTTDGKLIEETFYDDDGNLYLYEVDGYARKVYSYDSDGKLTEEVFYDNEGNLCLNLSDQYTKKVCSYNSNGNLTEETFYDREGNLCLNYIGEYARKSYTYDANGKLTEETFYDTENNLCINSFEDYARKVYEYNSNHQLTVEAFYAVDGELCSNMNHYAKKVYTYDKNGKLIAESFHNPKGELCLNDERYAKKVYIYNSAGNISEETYYNEREQKCVCRTLKYSSHRFLYDNNDRLISESYVDTQGNPCFIVDKTGEISGNKERRFTTIRYNYITDEQGNIRKQAQYSLENDISHRVAQSLTHVENTISGGLTDFRPQNHNSATFSYFAFISYSSKDVSFANKLQRYIESFKLPVAISQRYPRSPRELKPIFRDRTDLEQGNLGDMLMRGLSSAKYLLVICSENSAKPNRFGKRYVDMEVNSFIALNPAINKSRVIPIIYRESLQTMPEACIPPAISEHGLEGIDILQEGIARTLNHVVANMVEVDTDTLWQYRQKKRNKKLISALTLTILIISGLSLGGICAGIIAIITTVLLMLTGVGMVKNYCGTRIILYDRMMEEHNLPIGIRELTKQEATTRKRHYRFYYKGYRLRKIECCNAQGTLIHQNRPGYSHDEVARIELFYDDKGAIVRQVWSDERGIAIRDVQFETSEGHDTILFRHPYNPIPATHRKVTDGKNTSVTAYNITRNAAGHITEIRYYNHLNQACPDTDGTWGRRYVIDIDKSIITARYCLDESGNIMRNHQGIAGRLYEYNEEGLMTSYTNIDEQGQPVYEKAGYARLQCRYNEQGHCIEVSYHKPDGTLVLNQDLVAMQKISCNKHGYTTEESYYNDKHQISANKFGYAQCRYQHDDEGRIRTISYYDEQGKPCRHADCYHREERVSDTQGHIIQKSYYDEANKPCFARGGMHRSIRKYDKRGNIESELYQDTEGKPCYHNLGFHKIQYEYDDCQNLTCESYYDTNLLPCYNADSVAKTERQYDSHNNCIQETYYSTDNKPCINSRIGISACYKIFNSRHELIEEHYKGTTGLPILNHEAVSSKKWEHDARIRKVSVSYSDPCNRHGVKHEKWLCNLNGQTIRLSQIFRFKDSVINKDSMYYTWQYDESGTLLMHTLQGKIEGTPLFDLNKKHLTHCEYDEHRNLIRQWFSNEDGPPIYNANVNEEGTPIYNAEGIAEWRFEYDRYGRKIAESYYNEEGSPILTPKGYARMEIDYDEHGFICQQKYFDEKALPCTITDGYALIKLQYSPNERLTDISYHNELGQPVLIDGYSQIKLSYYPSGHLRECRFLNPQGEAALSESMGIAIYQCEYDSQGRKIRERYLDKNEQACLQSSLAVSCIEWGYNSNGQHETVCFKNQQEEPCSCRYGYAKRTTRYISSISMEGHIESEVYEDAWGRTCMQAEHFEYRPAIQISAELHPLSILETLIPAALPGNLSPYRPGYRYTIHRYNSKGKLTETNSMNELGDICCPSFSDIAKTTYKYDKLGNLLEEMHYDEKGQLCQNADGYAQKKCSYDSNGNLTEETFLNTMGKLCIPPGVKYARKICSYNENGLLTEESFWDDNFHLVLQPIRGFAKRILNYNSRQRLTLCSYYNTKGMLSINKQGYSQAQYDYDQNGNLIEVVYLNSESQPCINRRGYAREVSTYDANNNLLTVTYLNREGRPCINTNNKYSKVVYTYDQLNRCTRKSYFDEQGSPCLYRGLFANQTHSYDEQGREIQQQFHGVDGKCICITDKFGRITGKRGARCAYITYSYETNEAGEEVKKARYFDELGNEVT